MKKVALGGERLGSGNNQSIYMDGFHASNHDLSYVFRSTMDCGTLVPFMKLPMMIGDNFDIDLSALIKTLPTGGPLYGSFSWQAHLFFCPNRLYIGGLHNNATGIGRKMGDVLLPTITYPVKAQNFNENLYDPNQEQVAPDSLTAYLGIRGFGENISGQEQKRSFNGLPFLAIPDIFKNFYSNKQEKNAYVIAFKGKTTQATTETATLRQNGEDVVLGTEYQVSSKNNGAVIFLANYTKAVTNQTEFTLTLGYRAVPTGATIPQSITVKATSVKNQAWQFEGLNDTLIIETSILANNTVRFRISAGGATTFIISSTQAEANTPASVNTSGIGLQPFPLENIDEARDIILSKSRIGEKVDISENGDINFSPYVENVIKKYEENGNNWENSCKSNKNGLLLRTYKSDIFNAWLNTEWIDEINAATAIQIGSSGQFTMDALVIAKRSWEYQNRVGVSGGTYQDWEEAAYGREAQRFCESPIFVGGASGIIAFEEVVSTAASGDEALGSLAGQGGLHGFKGGKINVKAQEHGYLIGIVSIVPNIDYSQGNDWDMTELKSMESYHLPNFDGIGFQDLITERMAAWDTKIQANGRILQKSVGKQPAWSQYMSNVNKVYGDFCRENNADYMVINRSYQPKSGKNGLEIGDLTTYVFPQHYNYLFATDSIEDNPFWVQIGCNIFARRIMSAAIMPTL